MRILLNVKIPHQPFNAAVKDGTAGSKLSRILEAIKPEAVYFTEQNGQRGAVLIGIAGEHLTGAQRAAALTRALGQEGAHVNPRRSWCLCWILLSLSRQFGHTLDCQTGGFYPEVGIQEANLRPTCDQSVHSNV
jgi:hypothetical protein